MARRWRHCAVYQRCRVEDAVSEISPDTAQDTDPHEDNPLADMPVSKVLLYVGLQAAFFTLIGWGLWAWMDRPALQFVTFDWTQTGQGMALALALIALSLVLTKLFPEQTEKLIRSQARNYPFLKHRISIAAIIFVSLCAGVGEEALFRGGLQTLLGDTLPLPIAIALAAALFAAIHFAQPLNSALIFIIGATFGVIYWQTGSLLTVMIGHAVYDIYAIWALQKAMHELGVFDEEPQSPSPFDEESEQAGPQSAQRN